MPLPISRRDALDGGDVTLQFAAVELVTAAMTAGFPSMFPAAGRGLPFQALLGKQAEMALPVELANYAQVAEKVRQLGLPTAVSDPPANISAAALDDPGPIVSASQFSRNDLPVFLLRKLDGSDEALP